MNLPLSRISIIVPTLNEEATLEEVLTRCKPYAGDLFIIDGHSTDRTVEVAKRCGVRVEFATGKGKGLAMREAAQLAHGDLLVFVDADGSHVPEDIPKLLEPLLNDTADNVTASRLMGGSSELHGGFDEFFRLMGSSFITACINWRFEVRLSDSQNGFRAIKKSTFLALGLKARSTIIEQEMIMKTVAQGYRMAEIPSHEYVRKGGVSKINVFRSSPDYIFSLLRGMFYKKRR